MQRAPNELWISAPVLASLFYKGSRFNVVVTEGPDAEAQIINVEFRPDVVLEGGSPGMIVITYDRPVCEPVFHARDSVFVDG